MKSVDKYLSGDIDASQVIVDLIEENNQLQQELSDTKAKLWTALLENKAAPQTAEQLISDLMAAFEPLARYDGRVGLFWSDACTIFDKYKVLK